MKKELHKDICDESVFSGLYQRLSNDLYKFLYYKYGEGFSPDDKMQEAFVRLWENCKKVTVEKARSFLFTVANNMMLNEAKHQKVVLKYRSQQPEGHTNESPEFLLQKEEYFKKYQEVLSRLTEEQRTAFLLNKVEGKKHAEIAEMLGVTRKVVEYRIYSAFDTLRSELDGFRVK